MPSGEGKGKRGRPAKFANERTRGPLTIRLRDRVRSDLERAAKDFGRSLSEEVEYRLEQAFRDQKLMVEALALTYGQELAGILFEIAEAMKAAGQSAGFRATRSLEGWQNWFDDPYAFSQAAQAAAEVVDRNKPDGQPVLPQVSQSEQEMVREVNATWAAGTEVPSPEEQLANHGRKIAKTIIEEAASGFTQTEATVERARFLHRNSGRLAQRLRKFCSEEWLNAPTHLGDDR